MSEYSISDIFDHQKWIFPPTMKLSDFLTRDYDRQTKTFFDHVMELKFCTIISKEVHVSDLHTKIYTSMQILQTFFYKPAHSIDTKRYIYILLKKIDRRHFSHGGEGEWDGVVFSRPMNSMFWK